MDSIVCGVTKSQTRLSNFHFPFLTSIHNYWKNHSFDFPGGSDDKVYACKAGDLGSIPGLGRSPGEGNGNPLQYACLENPMDEGGYSP